jgi:hypothetical protein
LFFFLFLCFCFFEDGYPIVRFILRLYPRRSLSFRWSSANATATTMWIGVLELSYLFYCVSSFG